MAGEEIRKGEKGSLIQKLREDPVKLALLIVALLSLATTIYFGMRSRGEAEKMVPHMTTNSTPKPSGSSSEKVAMGGGEEAGEYRLLFVSSAVPRAP